MAGLLLKTVVSFVIIFVLGLIHLGFLSTWFSIIIFAIIFHFVIGTNWKESFMLGFINFMWILVFLLFVTLMGNIMLVLVPVIGVPITMIFLNWTGNRHSPHSFLDNIFRGGRHRSNHHRNNHHRGNSSRGLKIVIVILVLVILFMYFKPSMNSQSVSKIINLFPNINSIPYFTQTKEETSQFPDKTGQALWKALEICESQCIGYGEKGDYRVIYTSDEYKVDCECGDGSIKKNIAVPLAVPTI